LSREETLTLQQQIDEHLFVGGWEQIINGVIHMDMHYAYEEGTGSGHGTWEGINCKKRQFNYQFIFLASIYFDNLSNSLLKL
jgi:hypothetical protein